MNRYKFIAYHFLFLLLVLSNRDGISTHSPAKETKSIKHSVVKSWADKLGLELWHLGDFITRRKEVQDSFKPAEIVTKAGGRIIEPMAQELKYMFDQKISAVKRIMESAQNTALTHERTEVIANLSYYNAKEMLEPHESASKNITNLSLDDRSIIGPYIPPSYIVLKKNKHFFNTPVNTSMSSVHIPTNVFDRDNATLWAIQWSEKLDNIFLSNYLEDPTLSWQFFGSATGFMRQFPASKWKSDPVDLYDCRLRSWYIEAANSPKDIVVLVDVSGSMTGQRKDIARHVVYNILDTLGTNDFVNIFKFDEEVHAVVPCFNTSLVQATLANIRELKMGLEEIITDKIANYSAALIEGFEALEEVRNSESGANCNQAIMLVSDGVPYDFTELIERYNLQNNTYKPVRIFTYLIGKEVADVKKIKEMACNNLGYYVHLSTLAEVREQVLNYIPVMARPLVLGGDDHPIIWTQAYADVIDPQMTDWMWEVQEKAEQKALFESHRRDRINFGSDEQRNRRLELKQKRNYEQQYDTASGYDLVTTVSIPVFDKRKNATYIANLLGVAGTDIPIKEIQKLMSPFQLGVNGYGFLVTNNGFVLTHPDLRPVFQGILKPAYNSIDLAEVELLDDNSEPRQFDSGLLEFREQIINQTTGSKFLIVKQHLDNMKRVSRLTRLYYWTPIENTPFTLVISYPKPHGLYRVKVRNEHEIHRWVSEGIDITSFFTGRHWKIHPDWIYCRHNNESHKTPEKELLYFLKRIKNPGWKWKDKTSHYSNSSTGRKSSVYDKDSYYCDRELMQQLVFDAKVTGWFSKNISFNPKDDKGNELKLRFGLSVAFLATQSGLTRWMEFYSNVADEVESDQEFSENNNRATDEVWYKRAIEQHFIESQSFVFSVPFDVGDMKDTLVTASHAIFLSDESKSAPAAVVGFQFQHTALYNLFKNITSICGDSCDKEKRCFTEDGKEMEAGCYVLDNNGYVVISPNKEETGRFFGEVRGWLMKRLVEENIYQEVTINDYQAVCFQEKSDGSSGSLLQVPMLHFINLLKWFGRVLTWAFVHITMMTPAYGYTNYDEYGSYADASTLDPTDNRPEPLAEDKMKVDNSVIINRTRLQPCDQVTTLYTLDPPKNGDTSIYDEPANDCERPFVVVPIPGSNLILVVFDINGCPAVPDMKISIIPIEEVYSNESLPCHRRNMRLPRRRPPSCINRHVNESLIDQCGRGYSVTMSATLIGFLIFLHVVL